MASLPYNYAHFRAKDYPFGELVGPALGSRIAAEVQTVEGETVDLGKRDGRPAVIETGSITCSIYTSKIDWMQEFAKAYPEVDFFVVYTRETHPGGRVAPHASFDDKLACARAAKSEMGERRTILVDGIDGALHQQLGSFPNMLFVIDGDSRIVYRARWNDPEQLDEVLTALVRADALPHTESTGLVLPPKDTWRKFSRGGLGAVIDFALSVPRLAMENFKKRFKTPVRRPPRTKK